MAETDERRAVEFAKCAADAAYLTNEYLTIDDAQGHGDGGGGTMPFQLWPAQTGVMWQLMTQQLIIILKARQLGISWICCAYALWRCLFQSGQVVLIYSKGQLEANKMLGRVKRLYERLPPWLLAATPARTTDNTTVQGWANGSRIESLPASPGSGRSETASVVILDEAAFLQFADALFSALKPTIDGGGQLIMLSTANGIGNLFHQLWLKAAAGLNSYVTIFLPWWARPGRDAAWYARQLADYPDPAIVKQEYPANATEAFLVSGRTRFPSDWIAAQAPHVRPGIPVVDWPDALRVSCGHLHGRNLTIYARPDPNRAYVIGADVAEGLEHGDYSSAVLIDAQSWEEIASLHGHWEPDEYARLLLALAAPYDATIAVERNNHGHAALLTLSSALRETPGEVGLAYGLDGKLGWLTNAQSKPIAIDGLAVALRDELTTIHTQATLDELAIYRILANGATGAPSGYHDDRVMALAIAIAVAERLSTSLMR
jgi:hypothetical protein